MWKQVTIVWKIILLLVLIAGVLYLFRARLVDTDTPLDIPLFTEEPAVEYPDLSNEVYTIEVDDHPTFGSILIDADGNTLYRFSSDGAGVSQCLGVCAETWPPVVLNTTDVAAPVGIVAQFSNHTRADGTVQMVFDGSPLYYYSGDEEPGDAFGHGINDTWSVVSVADPYGVE